MKIAVACKILPDDQDIQKNFDGSLDCSKARQVVSEYDINAVEAAVRLANKVGNSTTVALCVGPVSINDSKTKKSILARGVDELVLALSDSCSDFYAYETARNLAFLVQQTQDVDLVVMGDGSANLYAQQADIQLAAALNWPCVSAVSSITKKGDFLIVDRLLENMLETIEVSLPAVVSVVPAIALPRIPGMKDILAAGKKPMTVTDCIKSMNGLIEVKEMKVPKQTARKCQLTENLDEFVAMVRSVLK